MKRTVLIVGAVAAGLCAVAAAQDRAPQPGLPTQARVWIQNRGAEQAVPVALAQGEPIRVTLAQAGDVRVVAPVTVNASRATWGVSHVGLLLIGDAQRRGHEQQHRC